MTNFERPNFTIPDGIQAEQDLEAEYLNLTGKTLFPAQPEKLLVNWAAYLKTVTDTNIQFTGEQCLVNFAVGNNLDQLGTFWDTPRLSAEPAITLLQFTLTALQSTNTIIPQGTIVVTNDGLFNFATIENLIIPPNTLTGTVVAECTVLGEEANGYAVGTINQLFGIITNVDSVTNLTPSNSGAEIEGDDRYRERLKLAPNKLTTAGSVDHYKFLVLSSDSSIISVGIESPNAQRRKQINNQLADQLAQDLLDELENNYAIDVSGVNNTDLRFLFINYIAVPRYSIDIYILTDTGLPSNALLSNVQDYLDADTVRPLTDVVRVLPAKQKNQNITVEITALVTADLILLQSQLEQALDAYIENLQNNLGFDIVPSQIINALFLEGVYQVDLISPTQTVDIDFKTRAFVPNKSITIIGVSDP